METPDKDAKKYIKAFHDMATPPKFTQRIASRRTLYIGGLFSPIDISKDGTKKSVGSTLQMTVVDLSSSGCAFTTKYFLPVKRVVKIKIDKLTKENVFARSIEAEGEVVYCKMQKDSLYRIGVRFTDIDFEIQDMIKNFTELKPGDD